MIDRYLSIWEVAHRWRDVNPDKTDPTDIPLAVQDTIRYICHGILDGGLAIVHLIVMSSDGNTDGSHFRSEIRPYHVDEIPPELENCLYRKYNKDVLNAYFIEAENLFDFCLNSQRKGFFTNLDFPSFWSDQVDALSIVHNESDAKEPEQTQVKAQSLRPSQIDKLVCQAIAKTLWDIYPTMNITAMSEHSAILEHGGGKIYIGKNTLRDWVKDVAPENVRNKPGRPKTNEPQ